MWGPGASSGEIAASDYTGISRCSRFPDLLGSQDTRISGAEQAWACHDEIRLFAGYQLDQITTGILARSSHFETIWSLTMCGYLVGILAAQRLGNFRNKNGNCQQDQAGSSARKYEQDLESLLLILNLVNISCWVFAGLGGGSPGTT